MVSYDSQNICSMQFISRRFLGDSDHTASNERMIGE
jgi:hypothetical protein